MNTKFAHILYSARTDVGKKRKNNEDAFGTFPRAGIFCVADGMGGGDDGEIASAAVVKSVEDATKICIPPEGGAYAAADVADVLESGLVQASEWIFNRTAEKKLTGCGSTFVGVVLDATRPDSAVAVHAGDSRLYLIHGRNIKQITRDHSVAEMLGAKDEKKINPMFRSMVMNAIGIRPKVEPERTPFKVAKGDRILICSDGLSRMVPDKKLLALSRQHEDVHEAVDAMIAAALDAGGIDNVTVVLLEVGILPLPETSLPLPDTATGFTDDDDDTGTTDNAGDSETQGSAQTVNTVQTVLPTTLPRPRFDLGEVEGKAPPASDNRNKWLVIGGASLLLVLVMAGVTYAFTRKASTSPVEESPVKVEPVPQVQPAPVTPDDPLPPARSKPIPTESGKPLEQSDLVGNVQSNSDVAPSKPTAKPDYGEARPSDFSTNVVQPAVTAKTAVVASVASAVSVTSAPPASASLPKPGAACDSMVQSCDVTEVKQFLAFVRQLFPEGKVPYEYLEQARNFESSSKKCSRSRSVKSVENAAVDLKFMLQAAEDAKAAFEKKVLSDSERRWLDDWHTVVSGDVKLLPVQEACARLISGAKEMRGR